VRGRLRYPSSLSYRPRSGFILSRSPISYHRLTKPGRNFAKVECSTIPNLSVYFAMPVLASQIHAGCGLNFGACISRYNFRHRLSMLLLASWLVNCKIVVYYTTSAKLRSTLHTTNGIEHRFSINKIYTAFQIIIQPKAFR